MTVFDNYELRSKTFYDPMGGWGSIVYDRHERSDNYSVFNIFSYNINELPEFWYILKQTLISIEIKKFHFDDICVLTYPNGTRITNRLKIFNDDIPLFLMYMSEYINY